MKHDFKIFQVAALVTIISFSTNAISSPLCRNLFSESLKTNSTSSKSNEQFSKDKKVYAKGINAKKNPDGHFQISYESEYLFSESGPLLRDYAPLENVMPKTDWLALSDIQRIDWIKNKFGDKPEHATAAGLRRIVDVDFLPEELIVDSTGNLEIVINPPLDTYKQWENIVDYITKKYGVGSQQAMISKPREASFNSPKKDVNLENEHLGWLHYTNLFDTFEKLDSGYSRYLKNPEKLSAQFFDHPFVGPMNKIKRDVLENYLRSNAKLEKYDDASKNFVRKSDASFKYTSGPSYRPDIAGPFRWAWEIRNAHKDLAGLKAKVLRDLHAHKEGLRKYEKFSSVQSFDTTAEFKKLPTDLQNLLIKLFPSKADLRFDYNANEKTVLETYRNFSMPLMNLESLIKTLSTESNLKNNLLEAGIARTNYFDGLNQTAIELDKKIISVEFAKAKVMGLLCKWASESKIYELFKAEAQMLGHDTKNENLILKAN